jgi:hypothetical protein
VTGVQTCALPISYAGEFEDLLRDGVEYDDDNSGTITNSEREAYHRQRLIR